MWKEEEKKLHYPSLIFVATQILSFCNINPGNCLSLQRCWLLVKDAEFLCDNTSENIQGENYLKVNTASV